MLNPNAQKWVDALLSGKYSQAKGFLAKNGSYCCLGVACEVAIENGIQLERSFPRDGEVPPSSDASGVVVYTEQDGGMRYSHYLPKSVQDWLGLSNPRGRYKPSDRPEHVNDSLAGRNDAGADFERIAEIIQSEPQGLFASHVIDPTLVVKET